MIPDYEMCEPNKFKNKNKPYCGCGLNHLDVDDRIVYWLNKYWVLTCAFEKAVTLIIDEDTIYNSIESKLLRRFNNGHKS